MDYTYAIIDSDAATHLQLQLQLQEYGDFSCTATAQNINEGLNAILKFLPDVVIVNLSNETTDCLQMVAELHQFLKKIPLMIGYAKDKDHAYDALKSGFFDYWLLPHSEFDIRKTIFRIRKEVPADSVPTTICLKSYRDYHYLNTDDILYLKADNNTTDFIMRDGSTVSAYKTLKTFEKKLPTNFIRVHQSYILNGKYVARINYGKSICTLKNDKSQLPFSKSYLDKIDALKNMLSKNSIKASE
ncbi:LytTR family DNA-binding domain-containing protein [Allomuricauda sp. SCSIO 65647]|uniref:LytR/AlgR family response regulator transcription factor n=1 Tax=Allomuricauda sp. SCSIO 65647 TaxID=2908843 RepID=UPI001F3F4892|nr:LytTR family DNA-binding domain-containing protein [Muricauda sp. SCSIO 65647]UJH67567.1 LytTR family transcriptional regulator DNA-binding domain-containing protein [Muricauda sp. SCSIO 65647]